MSYPFAEIEPKWQQKWEQHKIFHAKLDKSKPKYYALDMFPYPSGSGLHVGHPEGYTASDIVARYKRAQGYNVLHPMGWDAFGLPAEQYAIKTGIHPEETTQNSIATFKRQLKSLGFSYDWAREISTCDPKYYRWTQYIFLKLYEKGLAYQKEVPVNWCPELRTVLANDEVIDGKSERGGFPVEQRPMIQWMLKITDYAERLLADLEKVNWPEATKKRQSEWIGKSYGAEVSFGIKDHEKTLDIFTTRPDTIYGATFMVLAPEHPLVETLATSEQREKVKEYQEMAKHKSELDRQKGGKSGVFIGSYAINPVNNEEIPIWIADYVLMGYGTGAIMAVPGHDERDYEFAKQFDLPIRMVIAGGEAPYDGEGKCINSEVINGLEKDDAIIKIIEHLEKIKVGKARVLYRLRDWLFSRQRYWGEPFPVVHFPQAGLKTIAVDQLPVLLPPVSSFQPGEEGEPPLSRAPEDWKKVYDESLQEEGTRDLNTMPGAAGSSWYFLRYTDPHNDKEAFSFEAQDYWMPVDLYVGGPEHAVGHLLYARFWQKVLFDAGLVSHDEPFDKLVHQGMILGEDNQKMSKRRGNIINPDDMISQYGADAFRMYEMFMGPLDKDKPWSTNGLIGVFKFINKLWNLVHDEDKFVVDEGEADKDSLRLAHQTLKKVTEDIEELSFNTAISQMMICVNELTKHNKRPREVIKILIQCLAPFAPHVSEEIWEKLGEEGFVSLAPWPKYDPELSQADKTNVAVQVKGKTRGVIEVEIDSPQETVEKLAREQVHYLAKALQENSPKKVIFVPNRIINFII